MFRLLKLLLLLPLLLLIHLTPAFSDWQPLKHQPSFSASTMLLLTDGTVMCQAYYSSSWWRLTPDAYGSYVNGTWSPMASLPTGYSPLYYASAVLADSRVVVIGGEYNNGAQVMTNQGAIYDPAINAWTPLQAPTGWDNIGDAQCCVLPDGKFMLANPLDTRTAVLDPHTMAWNAVGTHKADRNDEEGWTLLPDGTVLTVDALNAPNAEKYLPWTGNWISASRTPKSLEDSGTQELGPAVLRPDGTVFATGATGHNAIYLPPKNPLDPGTWVAGPDFPIINGKQLDIADGPACLLPSGNVLCAASPGVFQAPTSFFEFDGTALNPVAGTPNAPNIPSFAGRMLLLPTGQVLYSDGSSDIEVYTPGGAPNLAWAPTISSCPTSMTSGSSYTLQGTQFNGLSQAVAYGDDATAATNYPLVRVTYCATGDVDYFRTYDHSTMGVATGSTLVSTNFIVPLDAEVGEAQLVVVANGIASAARTITVHRPKEILMQNQTTGRIGVWLMNGVVVQQGLEVNVTPAPGWKVVGTGDFNGDGKPDILMQNQTTGRIGVWLIRGINLVQGLDIAAVPGPNWQVVGTGDFNGDGKPDILMQNQTTGRIGVWLMNGVVVQQGLEVNVTPAPGWKVVGTGDFNGDGKPDILMQNQTTGRIGVWLVSGINLWWLMNGINVVQGLSVSAVPGPNWQVVGTGDFNGDGKPDILMQNQTTGRIGVWLMNGVVVQQGLEVNVTPAPGWQVIGTL